VTREIRRLDGTGWIMREALGDTWRWYVDASLDDARDAGPDGDRDASLRHNSTRLPAGWWPASVPGSVVTDLWRAGELPDPYRGRGTRASEWTGARSWVYRRTVHLPELADDEWATLELDGVDPSGRVFWDGRMLGHVAGLYRRARFAVPADATTGIHRLAVVIDPVPASQPQVGHTGQVRVHRPRMNEGWDFCPRLPHQGIWRGVRMLVGVVQLADIAVRADVDRNGTGRVQLTAVLEVSDDRPVPAELRLIDSAGGVAARRRVVMSGETSRTLRK